MSPQEQTVPPDSVEGRLAALEARVAALEAAADRPPAAARTAPKPPTEPAPIAQETPPSVSILGGIGRIFLILGGAFFLRALTESGTLHLPLGVALGLAYALAWALQAWRTHQSWDAGLLALASILIAYPLLVEATTGFALLSPLVSVVMLGALTVLHLAVARRQKLAWLAWLALWVGLGTGLVLLLATHAIAWFTGYLLLLGIGLLWFTDSHDWPGLRWPPAIAADLAVLVLGVLAAWPGGVPEAYRGLQPGQARLLAMALPSLYLCSFFWSILRKQQPVGAFEWIQSALAVGIGLPCAVRITVASGLGTGALGAAWVAAGLGCGAVAMHLGYKQKEVRGGFAFFSSLWITFGLAGVASVWSLPSLGVVSAILGLLTMGLGLLLRRSVLTLQGALCLGLATMASGLLGVALQGFTAPIESLKALAISGPAWVAALALGAAGILVELRRPPECFPVRLRISLLILGAFGVLCAGGLAVHFLRILGGDALAQPARLALLRTAVLSGLAVALASHNRRCPQGESRWLTYPVLALAVLKVLVEDLPLGRPMMLFLAFMCLGATLILVPRLRKPKAT